MRLFTANDIENEDDDENEDDRRGEGSMLANEEVIRIGACDRSGGSASLRPGRHFLIEGLYRYFSAVGSPIVLVVVLVLDL